MKTRLYRFIIVGLMFITGIEGSTQSRYRFFTLGMEQGLSSDLIWTVCQDKYNYMWIGTENGLNRYDGHSIRQYFHNSADSFSIPGNSIYWMYKDKDGELWFSLGSRGTARYNYAKDRFERFTPFDSIRKKNNYPAPLWRMGEDQLHRIYFACGGACFRYTKASGKMEDLTPLFQGEIRNYGVAMFITQGKQLLWILTDNGLFRYDLVTEQMRKIPFDQDKLGFGSSSMHDGEFINEHEMLVSVRRGAFVLFDTRTETFRKPPPPFDPTHSKIYSETGGVLKDSKGRIWLANSPYGLIEYFPADNSTYLLKSERSYPYPFPDQEGSGMNVYEDNSGNIWYCSSRKGVIWFKPENDFIQVFDRDFSKEHSLPANYVTSFLPLEKNRILIGTNNGMTAFDTRTNSFTNFPKALTDTDNYPHPSVRALLQSGDSVFIATSRGLSIYNKKTNNFSRYINKIWSDSIFPSGMGGLHRVQQGQLYIEGGQLIQFDPATKQFIYPSGRNGLSGLVDIHASHYDAQTETLWLEAGKAQLYSYDLRSQQTTHHPFSTDTTLQVINVIRTDAEGKLWLGTSGGLYRYDPSTRKSNKPRLQTSFPEVYNIALGDIPFIWIATKGEIVKYNPLSGESVILPVTALFSNSWIVKKAFFLDPEGFLWVGTTKGFGKIDTRRFTSIHDSRQPQLVRFSVFDQSMVFDEPFAQLGKIDLQ
ncbi:MAG TPA: two-component regulator propeller domain-containing protein, partial [Chitinophagaceae bacterium]|nr:two-component regulator propeller domain-containing protein [Chitinophagaceae bacterium]